jgi:hypothetical protein
VAIAVPALHMLRLVAGTGDAAFAQRGQTERLIAMTVLTATTVLLPRAVLNA